MNESLTKRQASFALAVAHGSSLKEAAVQAGYSAKGAAAIGCRLASTVKVSERIRNLRKPRVTIEGELAYQLATSRGQVVEFFDRSGLQIGYFLPVRIHTGV